MITAYHRPTSIDEAVELLARDSVKTAALGGGTALTHLKGEDIEVVDLQALGLNHVETKGQFIEIGATATLQQLSESDMAPSDFKTALALEAPVNIRNVATLGGCLVSADGRSSVAVVLLALDARISLRGAASEVLGIGELLPKRAQMLHGALITRLDVPRAARLCFRYVSRTPQDTPIVSVALALWPSGRARLALGGYGPLPLLAMDGTEVAGAEVAARNAFHTASDPWATAEYRMEMAGLLTRRCLRAART
jgi:CO/xanthine dehydrogenase FAD-binding subunit